jgi:hypothetical protein
MDDSMVDEVLRQGSEQGMVTPNTMVQKAVMAALAEGPLTVAKLYEIPEVAREVDLRWPNLDKSSRIMRLSNALGWMWNRGMLDRKVALNNASGERSKYVYNIREEPLVREKPEAYYGERPAREGESLRLSGSPKELTLKFSNLEITIKMNSRQENFTINTRRSDEYDGKE